MRSNRLFQVGRVVPYLLAAVFIGERVWSITGYRAGAARPSPPAALRIDSVPEGARPVITLNGPVIRSGNPFRFDRSPAPTPYDPTDRTSGPGVAPPRPALPDLTLEGIIGPPWVALVRDNSREDPPRVLVTGDTIGLVKVDSVFADRVVLHAPGADTTWILRLDGGHP